MYKTLYIIPSLLIIGLIIGIIISGPGKPLSDDGAVSDRALFRKIRYGFTIQNTTERLVESADFWTFAPVNQTSNQRCVNIEASHPYKIIQDRMGNQALCFTLEKIPPYACRVITVTADILVSDATANTTSAPDSALFLGPESGIESDHPAIMEQSRKLTAQTQIKTVSRFYNWVSKHIRYSGYSDAAMGALYAFRQKEGDCTEYAALFTALCRAAKIPARVIGGYVCTRDTVLKPIDYHNWAEFCLGKTWRIADPQKKKFLTQHTAYIAMYVHGESFDRPFPLFERFRVSHKALSAKMDS